MSGLTTTLAALRSNAVPSFLTGFCARGSSVRELNRAVVVRPSATWSSRKKCVWNTAKDESISTSWNSYPHVAGEMQNIQRRNILFGTPALMLAAVGAAGLSGVSAAAAADADEDQGVAAVRTVFVAGATGNTGRRIVAELLRRGLKVRAGVRSLEKGQLSLPASSDLQLVQVDVTQGVNKLVDAIGDADAVICATGFAPGLDLTLAWKVDNLGTVALVDACRRRGVSRFVLVSSLLTNGAGWGQAFNPNYILLNLFGLVLIAKHQAELYIIKSGINYTIVRPGGLRSDPPTGNIVMSAQDTLAGGSISRDSVAEVAVEALVQPAASYKIVEIISTDDSPKKTLKELFETVA